MTIRTDAGIFDFDPKEAEIIARMYKERVPSRQIAKFLDKPPLLISDYIRSFLMKRPKPPTIIGAKKLEPTPDRLRIGRVGGLRHHSDPLAAKEGSRMLLEALAAYFAKREGKAA